MRVLFVSVVVVIFKTLFTWGNPNSSQEGKNPIECVHYCGIKCEIIRKKCLPFVFCPLASQFDPVSFRNRHCSGVLHRAVEVGDSEEKSATIIMSEEYGKMDELSLASR